GITMGAVLVNAVTPEGCAHCRRAVAVEAREMAALAPAVRSAAGRRYAMISAPIEAPPPGGVAGLGRWLRRGRWPEEHGWAMTTRRRHTCTAWGSAAGRRC